MSGGGNRDERPDRPLALVDLALPRDIDPGVRDLPVTLVDLTDLGQLLEETAHSADVAIVRSIVADVRKCWPTCPWPLSIPTSDRGEMPGGRTKPMVGFRMVREYSANEGSHVRGVPVMA